MRRKVAKEILSYNTKNIVLISDLSNWKAYFVSCEKECNYKNDAEIYKLVLQFGDTITIGKTVGTPYKLLDEKEENLFGRHGIGKYFDI